MYLKTNPRLETALSRYSIVCVIFFATGRMDDGVVLHGAVVRLWLCHAGFRRGILYTRLYISD